MKIILDVWTGENSMNHSARFIRDFPDCMDIAEAELRAGNLVNLRHDASFGPDHEFDNRKASH